MTYDFADKAVLVTGSTRGIGRATAQAFADLGARVAINGRSEQSVAAAIEELGGGDRFVAAPGDVATVAHCEALVARAIEALGGLDVLVNNAGLYARAPIEDSDEALWDRLIDANVKGTYFCTRAALGALKASRGSVVNLASEAGLAGYANITVYCTTKGAILSLTRALAIELAPEVRVNCVCPGIVDTDMFRIRQPDEAEADFEIRKREAEAEYPLQRIATAEEIAQAIVYLASDHARFITGAALPIEGGATA